jgi:Type III restriction enzyme, res subunit
MLVAMATGTGKTFTMVNEVYRLMKSGVAKRILFLAYASDESGNWEIYVTVLPQRRRKMADLARRRHRVLSRPHLAQIPAEFDKAGVSLAPSLSLSAFPNARISSILFNTNAVRRRLNFGGMGGLLKPSHNEPMKQTGRALRGQSPRLC